MKSEARSFYEEPSVLRDEIYQSNLFLQAQKNFDLLGMRLFLIAASAINPHFSKNDKYYDKEFKYTFISTAKLTELLGSSKYLAMIPKACVKLGLASVKLKNDNNSDNKLLGLFKHIDYISREGLYVRFDDNLRPHLLDLLYAKKGYTKVNVNYLLKLTSLYAVRLLEVLLQFQNIPHYKRVMEIDRNLTIEQIRFMLNVPKGTYKSRMDNFRKHVLDIPIKEINDKTPYILSYKPIKKGTKVVGFKFTLSTHDVPFKVAGKKPQFSNDAINYLRGLGFNDEAARAIYNCCNGVEDCFLRIRRAETLLYFQKENIRNRLGFLRRAIEQDWHSGSMPKKEDPRSKPGWSAKIDYRSRRPGVPVRGPNKQVDHPPNYLPSDKMDKKLSNAIAQGEFYTPAEDNEQARQVTAADKNSTHTPTTANKSAPSEPAPPRIEQEIKVRPEPSANKSAPSEPVPPRIEQEIKVKPEPSANKSAPSEPAPPRIEQEIKVRPEPSANESAHSEPSSPEIEQDTVTPPPQGGESYYNESADKRAELMRHYQEGPEEYQRALEKDFAEELRELAEKKSRERIEYKRKVLERMETERRILEPEDPKKKRPTIKEFVDSVIAASNNKPGDLTPIGEIIKTCMTYVSAERVAAIREKRLAENKAAAENETAPAEPEPPKQIERAIKFTPQPPTTEPPKPPQKIERPKYVPEYLYILSPTEKTLATGGSEMYKSYKKHYEKLVAMQGILIPGEKERDLVNEKRAFENELLARGEVLPYSPPPRPKRIVNIPLPPPPPPGYEKNTYRLSKYEKLFRKSIKELVELYTEANRLNEEPESILKRTLSPDVEEFDIRYDTWSARDFIYVKDFKLPLSELDATLSRREILERWRPTIEFFVELFEMTPVEVMRRYVKSRGYLPPLSEPTSRQMESYKKNERDLYTGEILHPVTDKKY